jgi:hypothetical protein
MAKWFSIGGLILSGLGILVLVEKIDDAARRMDTVYGIMGYAGLVLILGGIALQVIGAYKTK